jgi:hypothetical protein
MKIHPAVRFVLLPMVAFLAAAQGAWSADAGAAFDSFYKIDLQGTAVPVEEVVLARPDATFTLKKGTFYPAEPLEGVVTGGVFLGEGEVVFRASQAADRNVFGIRTQQWLGRTTEEYKGKFDKLVLRFDDRTLEELGDGRPDAPGSLDEAESLWKDKNNDMDDMSLQLEMDYLEMLLNGLQGRTFFVAHFDTAEDGWLSYLYNQTLNQEIAFGNYRRLGITIEFHPFVWTNVKEDYDAEGNYVAPRDVDDKQVLDTEHYRITVTIPDTHEFTMESAIEFTPRVPLRAVRFDLVNNVSFDTTVKWTDRGRPVDVTGVVDGEGNPLTYTHKRHEILIEFPETLAAGETVTVGVSAKEQTIIQLTKDSYWLHIEPWFPQYGFVGGRNTHEWVVKIFEPLVAIASGKLVREWKEDGLNCTGWVMEEEVQYATLIFGRYTVQEDTYVSEVSGDEVAMRSYAFNLGDFSGIKKLQPVLDEGKEILKLYESLYGPYPYDYLHVVQAAPFIGFGIAPPGVVQLTGEAFLTQASLSVIMPESANLDFFHEFYAHELGHQWFAHLIGSDSMRDIWLHESFAEYSAGLYVQQLQGQGRFQAKMKEWRQHARDAEGVAPLSALNTLAGDTAGKDYTDLIYNKGPYVVHMLRMQMGHDAWVTGMKSFFVGNRHENVRTEVLRENLEQAAGYRLDFFFDQWFKGTGIPEFEFDYEVTPTEDGRFLFTGTIRQIGKPTKVLMPVFFHFGGNKVSIQQRPILKEVDVYKAFLPEKPRKVTLDDFNTLYAVIHQGPGKKKGG